MTNMNIAIRLTLALLATWRITHLLANEDGPADVVFRIRSALGRSLIGKLMDCFNCLSLWIAVPFAFFVSTRPLEWVMSWLALSGGACLVQRLYAGSESVPPDGSLTEGDFEHVLRPQANGIAKDAESATPAFVSDTHERS